MNIRFLIAVAACALSAGSALGVSVTYTVDPARSVLVASGNLAGQALETLSVGSTDSPIVISGLITSYAGTIIADRDVRAGTFRITGGNVAAQDIAAFSTSPPDPPAPENYSFFVSPFAASPGGESSTLFEGAVRHFSFALSGPPVAAPAGAFDVSQLVGTVASGQVDFAFFTWAGPGVDPSGEVPGSSAIAGDLAFAPAFASLADVGGVETIAIPVDTDFVVQVNGSPLYLHLSGELVATADVPEPSGASGAMAAAAAVSALRHRRHRRRDERYRV